MPKFLTTRAAGAVPILPLAADELKPWLKSQPPAERSSVAAWVESLGFTAEAGTHCLLPGDGGALGRVLAGIDPAEGPYAFAGLPAALPLGRYRLEPGPGPVDPRQQANHAALGWALGSYAFGRYRKTRDFASLAWPKGADRGAVTRAAAATRLVRDLINTPAGDMGPAELAAAARKLAKAHGARLTVTVGDALLKRNYPAVHAVGRASSEAPRLIDLRWGGRGPKVTLVGKGVCFDSGGLDLKTASGMRLMKKDMGGGAHAIGLAHMIMSAGLPVRLRMLVPAVENAVAGNAYRPGDVLQSRKGIAIEIDNTDAEGRVILCDALAEAGDESPDLMIDFATLTGAARVALGTDLPAMFCNRDDVAEGLAESARRVSDPLWRLPLHRPYRELIDSRIADIVNSGGPYAGAITAALFLEDFVPAATPWVHFDLMAWNLRSRPGRPEGGEAMGLRAVFDYLGRRYGHG